MAASSGAGGRLEVGGTLREQRVSVEDTIGSELAFHDHLNARLKDVRDGSLVDHRKCAAGIGRGEACHERRRVVLNRARVHHATDPHRALAGAGSMRVQLRHGQVVDRGRPRYRECEVGQPCQEQKARYQKTALTSHPATRSRGACPALGNQPFPPKVSGSPPTHYKAKPSFPSLTRLPDSFPLPLGEG
jgi:hypothetical protein